MPDQRNSDEIDLRDLLLKGVITIKANFWVILIFFVVGSAIGAAYFISARKVFESKMIISSDILTINYSRVLFENTNKHLGEGNTSLIAAQFNISEAAAKQIASLQIETLSATPSVELKENERFLVTAEVYDPKILPQLQKGLIERLENNEFVKVRVEQEKAFMKQMVTSIEKELNDMEQFKIRIFNGEFFQSAKGNIMFDPTTVNSKILELTEKKITLQNSLQLANSVQVIEEFSQFGNPSKPKLSLSIVAGSFIGLLFVGILIAFKSIRKILRLAEVAK